MVKIMIAPSRYIQGPGVLAEAGKHVRHLGSRFFVVGDSIALGFMGESLSAALSKDGLTCLINPFTGKCTRSVTGSLVEIARAFGVEVVVGVGGGNTIDVAKAVSHELGSFPLVVCPTVASTDAPCSALAVQHTPEGGLDRFLLLKRSPDVVLVDSQVIVQAPVRFFVSGMGDALATWFEAFTCTKAGGKNTPGGVSTAAALSLARLCYDTLMEFGLSAKLAVERQALTPAVERVIEANTLLSGLGFESSGLAAAHGINDGLATLEQAHGAMHGELVAFGTITQLVMECHPQAEIDRVIDFCKAVGLPITLKQLGITDTSSAYLRKAAEEACQEKMTTHNCPFKVTPEIVIGALQGANALGEHRLALAC